MSQVQLEAFFLVQNACTAFPSTLVGMLELSPPLPILPLLRVAGLSGLNTIIVQRLVYTSQSTMRRCSEDKSVLWKHKRQQGKIQGDNALHLYSTFDHAAGCFLCSLCGLPLPLKRTADQYRDRLRIHCTAPFHSTTHYLCTCNSNVK
jgi:hypothetical protein